MLGVSSLPPGFAALRLFGSHIRGDVDNLSDKDLLVVIDQDLIPEPLDKHLAAWRLRGFDVSVYSTKHFARMHGQGHLFAWHIDRESKPVDFDLRLTSHSDCITALGRPASYSQAKPEAKELIDLLSSCASALRTSDASAVYEAGLLYVVARNLAIIASWCIERLSFDVRVPYIVSGHVGRTFPLSTSSYEILRACRKASHGSIPAPCISRKTVRVWQGEIAEWAEQLRLLLFRG